MDGSESVGMPVSGGVAGATSSGADKSAQAVPGSTGKPVPLAAAKAAPAPKSGATLTPADGCESGYFVQWGRDTSCSAPEAP